MLQDRATGNTDSSLVPKEALMGIADVHIKAVEGGVLITEEAITINQSFSNRFLSLVAT